MHGQDQQPQLLVTQWDVPTSIQNDEQAMLTCKMNLHKS